MTSGSAGSNNSNSSISRVRTDVRSSPDVRTHQPDQTIEGGGHILAEDLHVGRRERGSMSSGAASAAATASGPCAVARIRNTI